MSEGVSILPRLSCRSISVASAAYRQSTNPSAATVLAEELEVGTAVVINEENILTILATLNNVMRLTRNDDSGHARHGDNLPFADRKVNK